jgi:hypothetical protein
LEKPDENDSWDGDQLFEVWLNTQEVTHTEVEKVDQVLV